MIGILQAIWELFLFAVLLAILAGGLIIVGFVYMTVYQAIRGRLEAHRG